MQCVEWDIKLCPLQCAGHHLNYCLSKSWLRHALQPREVK